MLTTLFSEWGFDSFAWLSGALWLLTGAGNSARRRSNFSLAREKSPKARLKCGGTRQNSAASPEGLSVRTTAASQRFHKRCVTALRFARARQSRDFARYGAQADRRFAALVLKHRHFRRDACASAAASQNAAAPSPAFGLTHDSCPNGAPPAQSEFYRVPPNSKRFLVTFWRKQKVTRPPGRTPGTRTQPQSKTKKEKRPPPQSAREGALKNQRSITKGYCSA